MNQNLGFTKQKSNKGQNETDTLKEQFMKLFDDELQKRKIEYFQAKEKKDDVFREVEHLKTSSRLLESRLKKKLSSSGGANYPLKLEIGIMNAELHENKDKILGNEYEQDLKIFYKVDNGKDTFTSEKVGNILHPCWDNEFEIQLKESKDRLYFEIVALIRDNESTQKIVDSFDISASIIEQNLKIDTELTDNILTSQSNRFTLSIKNKVDLNPKLQAIRNKIAKNEELFIQVEPPYREARTKFEKFLNLKGIELLEEWGICGNEVKMTLRPKTSKGAHMDEHKEEEKIIELNMDQNDRSYLGASVKMKKKKSLKGLKKSPEKNAKHSFNKVPVLDKYERFVSVAQVTLDDIGDINEKREPKRSTSHEKIKAKIEKKHLHKPYKTSATIAEREELSTDSAEDNKFSSAQKLTPSQKIMEAERVNDFTPESAKKKLTADVLKSNNLGTKRTGLGSSLINFAMQDLTHTNRVKSVYNQNTGGGIKIGGLMKSMDISNTLTGMLMMNNTNNLQPTVSYNLDEDNCSLISGNTFNTMQQFSKPMFGKKTWDH
jgi:hypothetical protein